MKINKRANLLISCAFSNVLGVILIWAALAKSLNIEAFAAQVNQALPVIANKTIWMYAVTTLLASELVVGLHCISKQPRLGAAIWLVILFSLFLLFQTAVALRSGWLTVPSVGCACFGATSQTNTWPQINYVARNLLFLAAACYVAFFARERESTNRSAEPEHSA